ncbi:MAG TPA: hypothetical protein VIX59_20305 [Candidatus Binataceae bacterium]
MTFHFQDLVPDAALDVIELEQAGGHRTPSRQPGALRPSEPIANQRLQAGQAFASRHRWLDNMRHREVRHMRQQFDLNILFRTEVSEQPAFRHSHLIGQNSEGNAGQARLAHQSQPLMQYPFTRRAFRIRHTYKKARPVVLVKSRNSYVHDLRETRPRSGRARLFELDQLEHGAVGIVEADER